MKLLLNLVLKRDKGNFRFRPKFIELFKFFVVVQHLTNYTIHLNDRKLKRSGDIKQNERLDMIRACAYE